MAGDSALRRGDMLSTISFYRVVLGDRVGKRVDEASVDGRKGKQLEDTV